MAVGTDRRAAEREGAGNMEKDSCKIGLVEQMRFPFRLRGECWSRGTSYRSYAVHSCLLCTLRPGVNLDAVVQHGFAVTVFRPCSPLVL
eukprot:5940597-Pleurochrysis_carterae.AAC.1